MIKRKSVLRLVPRGRQDERAELSRVDGLEAIHAVLAKNALESIAVNQQMHVGNSLAQSHHGLPRIEFAIEQNR